ncbi:hypothetical protein ANANG_G00072190 [Anguilla anguilla]|uniref:Dachshund homolog 2-like n=1 Tax=Anguilla anguilla TaxID=7936 RepID=A0A9D3MUY5_ANGAN|nr:hypothetical protein ANANG_G00072190 [Anguilla anguilla]
MPAPGPAVRLSAPFGVAMQDSSRLLPHGIHGLLSPGLLSHTGLTAMAEAMKLQKRKLMAMSSLQGGGYQNGTESENEELNSNAGGSESSWDKDKLQSPPPSAGPHSLSHTGLSGQHGLTSSQLSSLQQSHLLANRLDLPFMMMPHPLLPVSLPPASVAMAMNQMNHLNTIANMAAAAQMHSPLSRGGASVIKECVQDSPSPAPSMEDPALLLSQPPSHPDTSASSSPAPHQHSPEHMGLNILDGDLGGQDVSVHMKKTFKEKDDTQLALHMNAVLGTPLAFPPAFLFAQTSPAGAHQHPGPGLLKVAVDNTRVQDKQIQQEKKELKMELYREREMRESLERQLTSELQSRASIQKRLKKEKKAKRKLQEALEFESKRREQVEQALKQATSPDTLRMSLNEAVIPEVETEQNGNQQENAAIQENRGYMKTPIMY